MNLQIYKNKKIVWFNDKESESFTKRYKDSFCKMNKVLMKERISYTIDINLSDSEDKLLANMDKGTQYEIRRGLKEGLFIENVADKTIFINLYNLFAKSKQLNQISNHNLNFSPDLVLRGVKNDQNEFLAIHVYVVNEQNTIARLLYSATNTELFEQNRALIGRANRLLHYNDILFFKSEGFEKYDIGGYAYNTTDKSLQGINKFKEGFGGEVRKVYNYEPIIINILKYCYGKISSATR